MRSLPACALLAALLLAGLLAIFPDPDPDLWWHLKTGEVIVTQHTIPRADIFTYTAAGRPWVTHEWLSEVILHGVDRLGGVNGLVTLRLLLVLVALGLSAAAALIGPGARDRLVATALGVLLAAPLLTTRAFARPHMVSAAFLGAVFLLLRLGSTTRRRIWRIALLPLFLLWANLHSGFVLGLLCVALYWIGDAGRRPAPRLADRARWLGLIALVTLLNPNHVHAFLYPFRLMAQPEIRRSIVELRSIFHPDYRGAFFRPDLLVVGLASIGLIAGGGRRPNWAVLLPALFLGAIGVKAIRGVTELAVVVPILFGLHGGWLGGRRAVTTGLAAGVLLLTILGAGMYLRNGLPMGREGSRRAGLGLAQPTLPDQAAVFLRDSGAQGRLFNILGHGGYLIHELWPRFRVFIDGRLDVFPPGFLDAYGRLMSTGDGWDQICRKYDPTLAVVDFRPGPGGDYGLRRKLRAADDWSCVFLSHNAVVYARHVPANDSLLARFGCPLDPGALSVEALQRFAREAPPGDLQKSLSSLGEMVRIAPRDPFLRVVFGELLDAAGRSAEAAEQIRASLALGPESAGARLLLVSALLHAGSLEEARTELDRVAGADGARPEVALLQAELARREGSLERAAQILREAQAAFPGNDAIRRSLEPLTRAPVPLGQ